MNDSNQMLNSQAVICIALTNNLTEVISVTHSVLELLGFKSDDFLSGKVTLQSLFHSHDQDIKDVLFSNEIISASGSVNIRLRHADSRIRCIKGHYSKVKNPNGSGVTLEFLLKDAKSLWRHQGDQTLMTNFKAMMENTNDYIYFKDSNHVFTGASQTLVAITDPSEHWSDLIGKTDYDVFPEVFADIYYNLEKQVFSGIQVAHEEQEYIDNDGNKGWVDNRKYPIRNNDGDITGLFGIARDITDQKVSEQILIKSNYYCKFSAEGSSIDENVISCHLENLLLSRIFIKRLKLQKLLKYLVTVSYAGNGHRLKGYTIATEALGADNNFDSNHDSSVRVNVLRLRDYLSEYYFYNGDEDEVRFHLPKGKYEIEFLRKIAN